MPDFTAVLHAHLQAEDEVAAILAADDVKIALEQSILDEDEDVDVVQVIPMVEDPSPIANVKQLRRARNILIRTRTREAWDIAQQLHQFIHAFANRMTDEEARITYDYSSWLSTAKDVLDGGNPL